MSEEPTVEQASQALLDATPAALWEDWLPLRDALIAAVRAESAAQITGLTFERDAYGAKVAESAQTIDRLEVELKHARSMQTYPSGILTLVGKALDPTGNTHPNDYAPAIQALRSRCQQMEQALTRIAGISITGGGPYLIGENVTALALAALAPRTGPQTPTIRDAFDAGFLSNANDSDEAWAEYQATLGTQMEQEWKPIATAPKSTQLLLSDGYSVYWGHFSELSKRWVGSSAEDFTYSGPTHWMPLPLAPRTGAQP